MKIEISGLPGGLPPGTYDAEPVRVEDQDSEPVLYLRLREAPTLWDDSGPTSQGKILTAILQGHEGEAGRMLASWSSADLATLTEAAEMLAMIARMARRNREFR